MYSYLSCFRATGLTDSAVVIPQVVKVYGVIIESAALLQDSQVCGSDNTLGINVAQYMNVFQVGVVALLGEV